MKIVINRCYGGFNLSAKALKRFFELRNQPYYFFKLTEKTPVPLEKIEFLKDFSCWCERTGEWFPFYCGPSAPQYQKRLRPLQRALSRMSAEVRTLCISFHQGLLNDSYSTDKGCRC